MFWVNLGAIHKLPSALRGGGGGRGLAILLRNITEGGGGGNQCFYVTPRCIFN